MCHHQHEPTPNPQAERDAASTLLARTEAMPDGEPSQAVALGMAQVRATLAVSDAVLVHADVARQLLAALRELGPAMAALGAALIDSDDDDDRYALADAAAPYVPVPFTADEVVHHVPGQAGPRC